MHQSDDTDYAGTNFGETLAVNPGDLAELYQLGITHARQGQVAQARVLLEQALRIQPDQPDVLVALGNLLSQSNQSDLALGRYNRALEVHPGHAGALINMGCLFHSHRQYQKAVATYDRLLSEPEQILCLVNRALALHALGQFGEALVTLDYAHMLAPSDPEILLARGKVHHAMYQYRKAEADYRDFLLLRPADVEARIELAKVVGAQGRHSAGLKLLDEALRIHPSHLSAHFHRGNILREQRKLAQAVDAYDQALQHQPDFSHAQWNKGLCLLLAGDFARGWPLYEARKRLSVPVEARNYTAPLWTGQQSLAGKKLFLYASQGLGDSIHFFRFIKPLEDMGARVTLSCQDELSDLLSGGNAEAEILASLRTPTGFDFHCPLSSVPLALNTRESTIPAEFPYLRADEQRAEHWENRIGPSGFRIGICWQGAPLGADNSRSFPLALLAGISRMEGVRLISLQKGPGAEQLANLPSGMAVESIEPFDDGPQAFLDTAAIMAGLDLVVTPDTAIAHLAGALGRPTCVMLKEVPDWRWMLGRTDSPWYPTLRLFRQPKFADWNGAFQELEDHIARKLGSA